MTPAGSSRVAPTVMIMCPCKTACRTTRPRDHPDWARGRHRRLLHAVSSGRGGGVSGTILAASSRARPGLR
jgi:hypothetical protein